MRRGRVQQLCPGDHSYRYYAQRYRPARRNELQLPCSCNRCREQSKQLLKHSRCCNDGRYSTHCTNRLNGNRIGQQSDQPVLERFDGQCRGNRIQDRAVRRGRLQQLCPGDHSYRYYAQRYRPARRNELQLPCSCNRCREQSKQLLKHSRCCNDGRYSSHCTNQLNCNRIGQQSDQPVLERLDRQCRGNRIQDRAVRRGRLQQLCPGDHSYRYYAQRYRPARRNELQLPGSCNRCCKQSKRVLKHSRCCNDGRYSSHFTNRLNCNRIGQQSDQPVLERLDRQCRGNRIQDRAVRRGRVQQLHSDRHHDSDELSQIRVFRMQRATATVFVQPMPRAI